MPYKKYLDHCPDCRAGNHRQCLGSTICACTHEGLDALQEQSLDDDPRDSRRDLPEWMLNPWLFTGYVLFCLGVILLVIVFLP